VLSRDSKTKPRPLAKPWGFWGLLLLVDGQKADSESEAALIGRFGRQKPTENDEMSDDGTLTDRQRRVIPHLLTSPSIEEGCRCARINKATVYEWLKDRIFREELKRQRDVVIERGLDSLKANISKATETLVKHLNSEHENISIRAAERIIEFTQNHWSMTNLERRIEMLESRLAQQGGHCL